MAYVVYRTCQDQAHLTPGARSEEYVVGVDWEGFEWSARWSLDIREAMQFTDHENAQALCRRYDAGYLWRAEEVLPVAREVQA